MMEEIMGSLKYIILFLIFVAIVIFVLLAIKPELAAGWTKGIADFISKITGVTRI